MQRSYALVLKDLKGGYCCWSKEVKQKDNSKWNRKIDRNKVLKGFNKHSLNWVLQRGQTLRRMWQRECQT